MTTERRLSSFSAIILYSVDPHHLCEHLQLGLKQKKWQSVVSLIWSLFHLSKCVSLFFPVHVCECLCLHFLLGSVYYISVYSANYKRHCQSKANQPPCVCDPGASHCSLTPICLFLCHMHGRTGSEDAFGPLTLLEAVQCVLFYITFVIF